MACTSTAVLARMSARYAVGSWKLDPGPGSPPVLDRVSRRWRLEMRSGSVRRNGDVREGERAPTSRSWLAHDQGSPAVQVARSTDHLPGTKAAFGLSLSPSGTCECSARTMRRAPTVRIVASPRAAPAQSGTARGAGLTTEVR